MFTPGQYLSRRRTAAGLTIADVAGKVATEPRLAEHVRADWIAAIEADVMPATFHTLVGLRAIYRFDFGILGRIVANTMGDPQPLPPLCRVCACSELDPCLHPDGIPCGWSEPDLCDACLTPGARA